MPTWTPEPIWKGKDSVIIGGGPSLTHFDFTVLKGKNVIGCNDAYRLGPEIVPYCFFGDSSFWKGNHWKLEEYAAKGGKVITSAPGLYTMQLDWLYQMARIRDGLHDGPVVGWNYSSGAAAVNVAYSMGAKRIFLLGFDMGKQGIKTHWHELRTKPILDATYARFIEGFKTLAAAINKKTDVKVLNVTDGTSLLPIFDRITFEKFHKEFK